MLLYMQRWLCNQSTVNFLETWEKLYNPNFKGVYFHPFRKDSQQNSLFVSAKMYVAQVKAIGITVKSGRYGGTYAHPDIALNFCYWLSPEFQVYEINILNQN